MSAASARHISYARCSKVSPHGWRAAMPVAQISGNCGRWPTRFIACAQDDDAETASIDRQFHLRIIELARNNTLMRLSQTYRALGMTVRAFREPAIIHAEHLRIVEAIEHNFADEAERQARNHVVGAREMIESHCQQGKFVPEWVNRMSSRDAVSEKAAAVGRCIASVLARTCAASGSIRRTSSRSSILPRRTVRKGLVRFNSEQVTSAGKRARRRFLHGAQLTAMERGTLLLHRVADELYRRKAEIARTITLENGKPLAQSEGEVAMTEDHLRWFAEEGRRVYGRIIPQPGARASAIMIVKTPIGVVGAIAPWNFPLVLAVRKVAPAMAAGCPVMLKPAIADAALRHCAWRNAWRRLEFPGRLSAGDRQCGDDRRRISLQSHLPQDHLHRIDRGWAGADSRSGGDHQAAFARTRRTGAAAGLRGLRSGRGCAGDASSRSSATRASRASRPIESTCRRRSMRNSSNDLSPRCEAEDRPGPGARRGRWAADQPGSGSTARSSRLTTR